MRLIRPHKVTIRGRTQWRVRRPPSDSNPKRSDIYLPTKEEAESECKIINAERLAGMDFHRLKIKEKAALMMAYDKTGGNAQAVLDAVTRNGEAIVPCTVIDAVTALINDKKDANKSREYIAALDWTLNNFATGRNHVPLNKVTVEHVREWLKQIGGTPDMRRAYITRLRGLFNFAAHPSRKWCKENPAKGVSMPERTGSEVEVFTADECDALMKAAQNLKAKDGKGAEKPDRSMVAYFALCLFGGLRPSEARRLQPENIRPDFIHVSAKVARKKREARNVEMNDALRAWLAIADPLPVPRNWKKKFQRIGKASGVTWRQDAMRHSYVTYSNLIHGWEKTVQNAGHSLAMMLEHYRAVNVTTAEALKFWGLKPEKI